MKTFLLLITALALAARAAEPLVTVSAIQPVEGQALVYAPMGALSGEFGVNPTGRLWFKFDIHNDSLFTAVTLTSIRVTIGSLDVSLPRNTPIAGNATVTEQVAESELITVPHPAAATANIRLYVSGNPTPKSLLIALAPYVPATPGGKYFFPANEGDIGPDEYFSGGTHDVEEGQAWGTDWRVYRVTATGTADNNGPANSDYYGWGVPIRAVADGIVLRTVTGFDTNPAPDLRAMQLMATVNGGPIEDVKVTKLSSARAATLTRLASGQVEFTEWSLADNSRQVALLGTPHTQPGESVADMAIDELSSTLVAGALRLSSNWLGIVVWSAPSNGLGIVRQSDVISAGSVRQVAITKLSATQFATAMRTDTGDLRVTFWQCDGDGTNASSFASGTTTGGTFVCVTRLSATRVATSMRANTSNKLTHLIWDYDGTPTLAHPSPYAGEVITRVASVINIGGQWVTAFRTSGGSLKLVRWAANAAGAISSDLTTTAFGILDTGLAITTGSGKDGTDNCVTASILDGNTFKIDGWGNPDADPGDPAELGDQASNTAGAVTHVSIDETSKGYHFVGVRTTGGNLRIMTWNWATGGGNCLYVLHGNCRVFYAHFQDGSIDTTSLYPGAPVKAGQVLGHVGNSGSAGNPHTHIHSDRIDPTYDLSNIAQTVADEIAGNLPTNSGTRPFPFSEARAMALDDIQPGGEGNAANSFATLSAGGIYNDAKLGIRPGINARYVDRTATAQNPDGRKETQPGPPAHGGPFHSVVQGLSAAPSGARMFIRGGSYAPAVIFNTPMIVRRYDYFSRQQPEGPAVIGK